MTNKNENEQLFFKDGIYSYPINCPACQEVPDVEPNESLAKDCDTCKGIGEITLQVTEDELADLYKSYLGVMGPEMFGCPFMSRQSEPLENEESMRCPFTGTYKIK